MTVAGIGNLSNSVTEYVRDTRDDIIPVDIISTQKRSQLKEEHIESPADNIDKSRDFEVTTVSDSEGIELTERTTCAFEKHKDTGRIIMSIISKDTGEVIKELPEKKMLDVIAKLWDLRGYSLEDRRDILHRGTRCEYGYNPEIDRVTVKVIDKKNDKVILALPEEEVISKIKKLQENGLFVDKRV